MEGFLNKTVTNDERTVMKLAIKCIIINELREEQILQSEKHPGLKSEKELNFPLGVKNYQLDVSSRQVFCLTSYLSTEIYN